MSKILLAEQNIPVTYEPFFLLQVVVAFMLTLRAGGQSKYVECFVEHRKY